MATELTTSLQILKELEKETTSTHLLVTLLHRDKIYESLTKDPILRRLTRMEDLYRVLAARLVVTAILLPEEIAVMKRFCKAMKAIRDIPLDCQMWWHNAIPLFARCNKILLKKIKE
jgi:hypothetical protein